MAIKNNKIRIIDVTPDNVEEAGVFCIKNKRAKGYHDKIAWFKEKINTGLRIRIAEDDQGKQLGFVEFMPSEIAWRPVAVKNYYFIQCIVDMSKDKRNQGIASKLIKQCENEARKYGKSGVCSMTSNGPWIATKDLFIKNGFKIADQRGRFELLYKPFNKIEPIPKLHDWTSEKVKYKGWNLIYSDQCPWHEKSITDLKKSAENNGINLKVTRITTPKQAQNGPSGFGTYALVKDGKLLADHYISKTRFENILKKQT